MVSSGGSLKILLGLSGFFLKAPHAFASTESPPEAPSNETPAPATPAPATPVDDPAETEAAVAAPLQPEAEPESPYPDLSESPYLDLSAMPIRRDSIFDAGYGTRGQVTVAIGGLYDALDPRAAAGASLRVPQFTSDARFGLGKAWSVTAHLNTILAINELAGGLSVAFPLIGEIRGVAQFQAGAQLGMLGAFGFESVIVAPEFRPLIGLSLPIGSMRWSLRGELVFAGPYVVSLGGATNTLTTPPPLANWNIALILENLLKNDRLWYAGVIMMGSTAIYQNWLLFPDTSHYDFYPRVVGGYEF